MEDILALTAVEMRQAIGARRLGVREVVAAHVNRAERLNPQINAIVSPAYEQALNAADEADRAAASRGFEMGPLFGLPVAHKDSFHARGFPTTCGCTALRNAVAECDSVVVARQRAAGAITLGKTNMSELGAGSHTFNDLFGATRNPYVPALSSGGSSGGAAAALACGFVALADGTDMGGSLRNPPGWCSVVGLRPTVGRVPMAPAAMAYNALTVAGPMGRTVDDVTLMFGVLAGEDHEDPLSQSAGSSSWLAPPVDPRRVKIAVSPRLGGLPFEPGVLEAFERTVGQLEAMGCAVTVDEPDFRGADSAFEALRALAFATNFGPLRHRHGDMLGESVRWNIDQGLALNGSVLAEAERSRAAVMLRMRRFMARYDFLVAPVSQVPSFPVETDFPREIAGVPMENYIAWMRSCSRLSVTGHPILAMPSGYLAGGIPVGIQIVGRWRAERELLAFGRTFEQAWPIHRTRPACTRP